MCLILPLVTLKNVKVIEDNLSDDVHFLLDCCLRETAVLRVYAPSLLQGRGPPPFSLDQDQGQRQPCAVLKH